LLHREVDTESGNGREAAPKWHVKAITNPKAAEFGWRVGDRVVAIGYRMVAERKCNTRGSLSLTGRMVKMPQPAPEEGSFSGICGCFQDFSQKAEFPIEVLVERKETVSSNATAADGKGIRKFTESVLASGCYLERERAAVEWGKFMLAQKGGNVFGEALPDADEGLFGGLF
jgi:hypothetical protein